MSENRIAASTPCRRTGCRVISVTRSGSWQAASIAVPARSARYSGSDRPAWRMNQTGVRRTGSPRAARTRSESAGSGRPGAAVTTGHPPRARTAAARRARCAGRRPTLRSWSHAAWPTPGPKGTASGGDEPPPRSAPPWRHWPGSAPARRSSSSTSRRRSGWRPTPARSPPGCPSPTGRRRDRARQRPLHRAVRPRRPRDVERHHAVRRLPLGGHRRATGRRRDVLRGRVELAHRRPGRGRGRAPQRGRHRHPHRVAPGSATSPAPSTPSTWRCARRGPRRTLPWTGTCSPGWRCSGTQPGCRRRGCTCWVPPTGPAARLTNIGSARRALRPLSRRPPLPCRSCGPPARRGGVRRHEHDEDRREGGRQLSTEPAPRPEHGRRHGGGPRGSPGDPAARPPRRASSGHRDLHPAGGLRRGAARRHRARSPSTPSAPPGTATGRRPTWSSCAAAARAPA